MTRKKILNISSAKKSDNMLTATQNLPDPPVLTTQFTIPAIGITPSTFIFSPTMRFLAFTDGVNNNDNARTKQDTFARGFKETLRFATSDGNEWKWRRICFSYKAAQADFQVPTFSTARLPFAFDPVATGYRRLFSRIDGGTLSTQQLQTRDAIYNRVFAGRQNLDWTDPMTARTDPLAVKIWYDKVTSIRSGNDISSLLIAKRWHPMNKNLIYQNEDSGKTILDSPVSETGNGTMGDYFIMDIFYTAPSDDGVLLSIGSDATYYWHER